MHSGAARLGAWAARMVAAIGVGYVTALAAGFARAGFDKPIVDPVLAVMEVLTLLSAAAVVITMAAVYEYARPERRIFAVVAFAFTLVFAGITSTVHFIELTAARQLGEGGIAWPSRAYAAELAAWDWFLGLALLFAAPVFSRDERERSVRRGLWIAGTLTFAGVIGPILGSMPLQRIGIAGYAVAMPIVFFMLARLLDPAASARVEGAAAPAS